MSAPHVKCGAWVSVDDQLPSEFKMVLAYNPQYRRIGVGWVMKRDDFYLWSFDGASGDERNYPELKFSHWMELPEPPK